jgi:chromosome segregation ATPase
LRAIRIGVNHNDLEERRVVEAEQEELIRAQGLEIQGLRNEIKQLREEINAAQVVAAKLEEATTRLDEASQELERLRAQNEAYRRDFEGVIQSASWRVTRPLRAAKSALAARSSR